jgi:carbamoyltransferase
VTHILGISAYYHDSAAALLRDGEIVAAAQEERFTRRKHDPNFPQHAIAFCLEEGGVRLQDIDKIVFYDKPLLKFERLLETYLDAAPRGVRSFTRAMPVWLKEKLFLKRTLRAELRRVAGGPRTKLPALLFAEHHQSHAGSAFYFSPFADAAVLCVDGVGEWATTSAWLGCGNELTPLWEIRFPHSLGLLYSAFTSFCGFKVNSGEYKLMGLAPYGRPVYAAQITSELVDLKADGSFQLNMDYFDYCVGETMTSERFAELFGGPPRAQESPVTQREMDLAASIQHVTEEVMLRLVRTLHRESGQRNLCLAGGVALNCVANGRLLREGPFQRIWIQPAAGDAGGALGAAAVGGYRYGGAPRRPGGGDMMHGGYLGPRFGHESVCTQLDAAGARYVVLDDDTLLARVAELLAAGRVVGWVQGRMEFGPRALGARSILGDPRSPAMQRIMNLKIKFRESFRPFAPAVLAERAADYFELAAESPYMLLVAPVRHALRTTPLGDPTTHGIEKLNQIRSTLPAVTHVDYSARVQTVHRETNPRFHDLLTAFERLTGCAVLVNTSFNVRGEPIVCSPQDAFRCFMRTNMDTLVVENFLMEKAAQAPIPVDSEWTREFTLD